MARLFSVLGVALRRMKPAAIDSRRQAGWSASLLVLCLLLAQLLPTHSVQATPLQQADEPAADDAETAETAETNANRLYLPLINSGGGEQVDDGQSLMAASVDQQTLLYTKYQYSRWSNPAGHFYLQMSGCGLLTLCSIQSNASVANMSLTDYATASVTGLSLFSSVNKSAWADLEQTAAAGDYAGWLISNVNLSDLSLFRNSYLRTYLNGTLQEQRAISTLLDWGLINNSDGGQNLSFRTTKGFNRVEIAFDSKTLGLSLFNNIYFYYAFAARMNDRDGDAIPDSLDDDLDGDGLSNSVEACVVPSRLNYEFYNSSPSGMTVSNIPTTGALGTGLATNFDVDALQRQWTPHDAGSYSVRYSGTINVPYEGLFTFYLNTEGGSALWVDDILVVNNDGWHGFQERMGNFYLTPGYHDIRILFFKYVQGNGFTVAVSEQNFPKQPVPFGLFISCDQEIDSDGDGFPNYKDWDSDNDAIPDSVEARLQ